MITEKSNRLQVIMITDYNYPISGCETSVKTAHFAIKEKLKESAVIKKDGKKQMTTGVRDLCLKIGKLADHGRFCCTVEEHGICFV